MWILSADAGTLLSVVQFDQKKAPAMAKEHGVWDVAGDYLLIRARVRQSLDYVCDVLDALSLGEIEGYTRPKVDEDKAADYHYRTIISRDEWKRYLSYEVDGIDYTSHVKEETVRRQPEPKIGNLYSALSATWTAWSKLQPSAPYSGKTWAAWKPDCKNCDHTELKHSWKGDCCNSGWKWIGGQKKWKEEKDACNCTKYEPKPTPPKENSSWSGTYTITKPAVDPEPTLASYINRDNATEPEVWEEADLSGEFTELMDKHEIMCPALWYDPCECGADDEEAEQYAMLERTLLPLNGTVVEGVGVWVNGQLVEQEQPVPGEDKRERKARQARNRRARRRATRAGRGQKQEAR